MDVTQIFCDVDDFCNTWEKMWEQVPQLPRVKGERRSSSRMHLSEVMTIMIAFHGSGYKTFKEFYTLQVLPGWRSAFPNLVSYNRFVELMPWCLMLLCCFVHTRTGEVTGISFIDSTPIEVCHPARAHSHKVFKGLVKWGKNSVGWYFGFKLHLVINEKGELLAFKLTPANIDDRKPVPEMTKDIIGKIFGDRGYISQELFEQLYERGLQLVTKSKKNMKNRLVKLIDKILLRKRAVIESVNDFLKNLCQIEHSRHRSPVNFMVNLFAGLTAYTYLPSKPSLDIYPKGLPALPPAIF
ncbi:MAG TPA: IS982 family transposase [Nostocaceae cyanobacterium]|nr:IS982 family transposase [Nostocaceae cyanobacterium]